MASSGGLWWIPTGRTKSTDHPSKGPLRDAQLMTTRTDSEALQSPSGTCGSHPKPRSKGSEDLSPSP